MWLAIQAEMSACGGESRNVEKRHGWTVELRSGAVAKASLTPSRTTAPQQVRRVISGAEASEFQIEIAVRTQE